MLQQQSMLNDLLQSTRETLAERISSPLLGSFTIAWSLWNYKFLVILFSAASVTRTFELIETVAFPNVSSVLLSGLLFPLLSALAYVFLYPYPARFVYGFTHRMRKATNRLRQQIEDETPLTLEESRKLRTEYRELERRNQETVDRLNSEIERLKEVLKQATAVARPPPLTTAERLYDRLEPPLADMLEQLDHAGGLASVNMLIQLSGEPKLQVEYIVGELARRGLLEKSYDQGDNEFTYSFTHDGRGALLKARAIQEAEELEGVK